MEHVYISRTTQRTNARQGMDCDIVIYDYSGKCNNMQPAKNFWNELELLIDSVLYTRA